MSVAKEARLLRTQSEAAPFLKWAGGKRWLAQQQLDIFPVRYGRYIEPFLGSGAIFFSLKPADAILSDINEELINAYRVVQRKRNLLTARLASHAMSHSSEHFYLVRELRPVSDVDRAARFIYLNRTCWNGLYRVNKNGRFNVPKGTKSRVMLETDGFLAAARGLSVAKLKVCDFEVSINQAVHGDLVFLDPPYTVKHNNNGFIKYNHQLFSWDDQLRLREAVRRADGRGVFVVMTNANHESIRDLYSEYNCVPLERHSVLSGRAEARGRTEELLIRNF